MIDWASSVGLAVLDSVLRPIDDGLPIDEGLPPVDCLLLNVSADSDRLGI